MRLNRRDWLQRCAAFLAGGSAWPAAHSRSGRARELGPQFAATWQTQKGYQVGVLKGQGDALALSTAIDVPTRAHGLLQLADGSLLTVARRPGDWLLRWHPDGQALAWGWIEADRAFNGHVISSADGRKLFTTETDLGTGQGLIGVRDASSLEKLAEWPTHGRDPHELLLDHSGALMVANGGIATQAETGRRKLRTEPMDSSLVRLDADTGALQGQWQLEDKELSLRHIAWSQGAGPRTLGIAMQAEHSDPALRTNAPVLALFDGQTLRVAESPRTLAGYGGDIASAGQLFAVSCPRTGGVALYELDGRWHGFVPLTDACALAAAGPSQALSPELWAGGKTQALALATAPARTPATPTRDLTVSVRLDNHWLLLG